MNKKQIKQLSIASFVRGSINPKKVLRISSKLKRSELRDYIKFLKSQIDLRLVRIQVPNLKTIDEINFKKQFSNIFPSKKIIIEENPDILLGMKIIDNDKIYDFNLKDSFESIGEHFSES